MVWSINHMQINEYLQFFLLDTCASSYTTEPGEYTLSKDLDVAVWLDYRSFLKEPSLQDLRDLVIII